MNTKTMKSGYRSKDMVLKGICCYQVLLTGGNVPCPHKFIQISEKPFNKKCVNCGYVSFVKIK